MAFVGSIHGGSGSQTLSPAKIFNSQKPSISHRHRRRPTPPIFISTNSSDVNPINLRDLCRTCNHSFHRFPNILPDGRVDPVDVDKLRIALSHSSVVVSVFARPELATSLPESATGRDWYRRMIPLTPISGQLVGFGRAVSDSSLTASIYDVMMIHLHVKWELTNITQATYEHDPHFLGNPFVTRSRNRANDSSKDHKVCNDHSIPTVCLFKSFAEFSCSSAYRFLTNKGIYDIAALCSDQEMNFFKACGFGDDMLGSTTMMYTRSGNDMVVSAGRKLLMVPPLRKP